MGKRLNQNLKLRVYLTRPKPSLMDYVGLRVGSGTENWNGIEEEKNSQYVKKIFMNTPK